METTFGLSQELRLILYGVNAYSKSMYHRLVDAGYTVVAYFDRRYRELKGKCPVPVYGLSDHPFAEADKDCFCVLIMLQNAMQHESIAMELSQQGFHKIFFVPMRSRLEEKTAQMLRFQYNLLLTGQFQLLREVPLFREEAVRMEIDDAHAIIKEEGAWKIVWCPAELLYTNPLRLCREAATQRYANVPLYSYYPYVSMFEYLQGLGGEKGQYLDEYGVNSCKYTNSLTNTAVLLQRKELLELYQDALNSGMDFFISSAPPAEWNERFRVFNLLEGQHRSLFLMMNGFRRIPIRVSVSDFEIWSGISPGKEAVNSLLKDWKGLHILHPKYNWVNQSSDRNDLLQLESIQKYLGGARETWRGLLEGKSVLDLSGTYGYFARNSLRMKAEEAVLYAPEGRETAEELHVLEGFSGIMTVDDWGEVPEKFYHSLFVMNGLAGLSPEKREAWIDQCGHLCLENCYVTVQNSAELESWGRCFVEAEELRTLFDQGRTVRLYVFRKKQGRFDGP